VHRTGYKIDISMRIPKSIQDILAISFLFNLLSNRDESLLMEQSKNAFPCR